MGVFFMNMRNIFLLVIQLFLLLLTSVCVILCEEPLNQPEPVYYTSPELAAILIEYCQQEESDIRDNLIVFIRNGLDQLGRIRKWYVNGKIEPNEAYSY